MVSDPNLTQRQLEPEIQAPPNIQQEREPEQLPDNKMPQEHPRPEEGLPDEGGNQTPESEARYQSQNSSQLISTAIISAFKAISVSPK